MKFVRFFNNDTISYGVVENDLIWELSGNPYSNTQKTGASFLLAESKLASPVAPQKIIGIGLNYMDHITSQGLEIPLEPYIVHRPLNTINCTNSDVHILAEHTAQFEGELALVIGKTCHNVSPEEASEYIFGYTIGNDITEKSYFQRDRHFGVAKSFDSQCPLGPWIITDYDYHNKNIRTVINGIERQNGNTSNMVFSCEKIVSYLSSFMTLVPGDVILTGSPSGVGKLNAGYTIEVTIEGIGTLINKVKDIEKSAKSEVQ